MTLRSQEAVKPLLIQHRKPKGCTFPLGRLLFQSTLSTVPTRVPIFCTSTSRWVSTTGCRPWTQSIGLTWCIISSWGLIRETPVPRIALDRKVSACMYPTTTEGLEANECYIMRAFWAPRTLFAVHSCDDAEFAGKLGSRHCISRHYIQQSTTFRMDSKHYAVFSLLACCNLRALVFPRYCVEICNRPLNRVPGGQFQRCAGHSLTEYTLSFRYLQILTVCRITTTALSRPSVVWQAFPRHREWCHRPHVSDSRRSMRTDFQGTKERSMHFLGLSGAIFFYLAALILLQIWEAWAMYVRQNILAR